MERGINFGEHTFPSMNDIKENLGWERLVKSHKVAIVSIMIEFYTNVLEVVKNRAMVRGVLVPFSASIIIAYYGMGDVG